MAAPKKKSSAMVYGIVAAAAMAVVAGCCCGHHGDAGQTSNSPAPAETRVPTLTANPKAGDVCALDLGGGVTLELMGIPPGEFMIGSTPEERARARAMGAAETSLENEGGQPRRAQIRNGFWIGRTELTVGQWQQFINSSHYQTDAVRGLAVLDSYPEKKPADHPMAWVTWSDAVVFCEWLTRREQGANRLPDGYIYRLPSEAEWEYACRGGRRDTMFWWGNLSKDGHGRLNWREADNGATSTLPVDTCGARGRNGFGLADALGNVREQCLDAWDAAGAHEDFCADYTKSKSRVLKGGSFKTAAFDARCARRWPCPYSCSGADIGFRVCCGINLSNETTRVLLKLMTPDAKPPPPATPPAKNSP